MQLRLILKTYKKRTENQATVSRDEKSRLLSDLKESQIKNEQIIELKRCVENDQKEKHDLGICLSKNR